MAEERHYPAPTDGYHWARHGDDVVLKRNPGMAGKVPQLKFDPTSRAFVVTGEANLTTVLAAYYPANNGFLGQSERRFLMPGDLVDRFGFEGGKFVAPKGTPFEMRSLPQESLQRPYNVYKVLKPIEVE